MIDTLMSNWGKARGKTNIYMVECKNREDAERVAKAGRKRSEMRDIQIHDTKPSYVNTYYLISHKYYKDLGSIWKEKL
jgi:hypothetical protein